MCGEDRLAAALRLDAQRAVGADDARGLGQPSGGGRGRVDGRAGAVGSPQGWLEKRTSETHSDRVTYCLSQNTLKVKGNADY